jgi:subtilisin family serine protease
MAKMLIPFLFVLLANLYCRADVNSVIVKINWKYLDFNKIDDPTIRSGSISEFLNQEGLNFLEENELLKNRVVRKVFPFLKTTDTISVSRLGQDVRIPVFWNVFAFDINQNEGILALCDKLEKLHPFVIYSHPNYELKALSVPNDSLYPMQQSLSSTSYPNGHINIEPIWEFETGKPHIKVGVHDSGIDTANGDIKVVWGQGYSSESLYHDDGEINTGHTWGNDGTYGHGTRVAGIIGATTNNEIGIAGIAGGNGSDTSGISLIDMRVLMPAVSYVEGMAAAIVDGARSPGTYYDWRDNPLWGEFGSDYQYNLGFGLHIANHSYTVYTVLRAPQENEDENDRTEYNDTTDVSWGDGLIIRTEDCDLCVEALLFSNENNVANVVARGNYYDAFDYDDIHGDPYMFPQKMVDHMLISVGAHSENGLRWSEHNNSPTEGRWSSQLGGNVDLLAPGTNTIVHTLRSTALPLDTFIVQTALTSAFSGTSSAAPHVSGVLALLLSYYNKPCYSNYNLANEDMEHMLQRAAIDVHAIGYDDTSGWGRLEAVQLFNALKIPYYQVVHPNSDFPMMEPIVTLEDTILVHGNNLLDFGPYSDHGFADPDLMREDKKYWIERYKVTAMYDFSAYLSEPGTTLLNYWVRKNTSTFAEFMEDSVVVPGTEPFLLFEDGEITTYWPKKFRLEKDAQINLAGPSTVAITGYFYHFIAQWL